ncbi:MAG: thioredoxin family protein [Thermofilaceae archaeon]
MGEASVEQVVLFVYKGDRCAQLVKDVYEVLKASGRQAKLRVVTAGIADPREYPSFLEFLEGLYGSQYVEEFKKYRVGSLPALVVGGEKLFEGRFPTKEELQELFGVARRAPPPSLPPEPATGVCAGCLFYDAKASRCLLLRVAVADPGKPPCGKRR